MSKQQHALLIQPPLFPKECPVERVEFGGFPCSYCHGNGWFWGVDDYGERIKQDCPVCKGNKRLKAVVTIACSRMKQVRTDNRNEYEQHFKQIQKKTGGTRQDGIPGSQT